MMPKLAESTTAVLVRGDTWQGAFASEPYEAGWAREAVIFVRLLKLQGDPGGAEVSVDVPADGMHWAAEGSRVRVPARAGEVAFAKVAHFGNWLRVSGRMPEGASGQALVTVHLKA
jgi:hypothetical protein